jgi:SAM-dependent methyltransferase
MLQTELKARDDNLFVSRNFYGVLRVRDYGEPYARRALINGTISHGHQFTSPERRNIAGSYFSASSGVGRALEALQTSGPIRFGVIGLGAGVLTSYARLGDYARIYEINPDVVDIARKYFSFLSSGNERGANVQVVTGDARLSLEHQPPQHFDLLAVDAFSSDAIPVHLLTNEAVDLYFRHLQPDGVLAIHISNRYLDLTPVCLRAAEHVHRSAILIRSPADDMANASDWVLITSNQALLSHPLFTGAHMQSLQTSPSFDGWTDQHTSLWPVLSLGHRALGAPP